MLEYTQRKKIENFGINLIAKEELLKASVLLHDNLAKKFFENNFLYIIIGIS